MRIPAIVLALLTCSTVGWCQSSTADQEESRKQEWRKRPDLLLSLYDASNRADIIAARLNISRDVLQKTIRIYATTTQAKQCVRKVEGYDVEVIFNAELVAEARRAGGGSYQAAHNVQVFFFATAQFAAGKKKLGLELLRLLAEARPDYFWSTPTHPPMTIQKIITGLEKEDASVAELLKNASEVWSDTVKDYGPQ